MCKTQVNFIYIAPNNDLLEREPQQSDNGSDSGKEKLPLTGKNVQPSAVTGWV